MGAENLPEKMQAYQVVEYDKPHQLREVPVPKDLKPYDLLVKVAVASYCHTDGMVQHGTFGTKLPCTASHEGAGSIVATGSSVKNFKQGDRIMCGLWREPCGKCVDCQPGHENWQQYCPDHGGNIGVNINGAFADYIVVDARAACKLPDKVSFETAAPLACAGSTIWRGIVQSGVQKGEWLAIVGSGGGLGHLGIRFAKAQGIKVIGIDARDEGLELTRDAGADVVIDARKGDEAMIKQLEELTDGKRAEATINVSDAPKAAATACAATKMHGIMVQIAQPDQVSVGFAELVFRDIRIHGSLICSQKEGVDMLDLVAKHKISVKNNIFHGLKEVDKLIELVHTGKMMGKGVVIVDQEQVDKEKEMNATV